MMMMMMILTKYPIRINLNILLKKNLNLHHTITTKTRTKTTIPLSTSCFINKKHYSTSLNDELSSSSLTTEQKSLILNKKLDEIKLRNMLIFESNPQSGIPLNLLGIAGACLICYVSYISYQIFGSIKLKEDDDTLFRRFLNKLGSDNFRLILCSVVGLIGIGIFFTSLLLTSRQVKRLYLLKGGKRIGVITEGIFGKNQSYTVNLDDASFHRRRDSGFMYLPFKIKKHFFYFLIHTANGEFTEKILFDYIVCLHRF